MTHPRLPAAVEWLRQLAAFNTIPANSNKPLVAHLARRLHEENGITGAQLPGGEDKVSFFTTIGPKTDGGIVLSGHTDVVDVIGQEWTTPPFAPVEKNDKLFARGACDMKGFLSCALAMAPVFVAAKLKKPVHFAFSRDEEIACAGTADMLAMIAASGMTPAAVLVGEPTQMQIVAGHKAGLTMHTCFYGTPAHSSTPAAGVSAIPFAVRFVAHLEHLESDMVAAADSASRFVPPHGTINVGVIKGGTALNILAAQCEMEWHYRGMPADDLDAFENAINDFLQNTLLPQMRASGHPANITNRRMAFYPGLEPAASPALQLAQTLTGSHRHAVVSFGTEAGHFQRAGIPAVVVGPGNISQAHKPDEYIELEQLSQCLYFLDKLCAHLAT